MVTGGRNYNATPDTKPYHCVQLFRNTIGRDISTKDNA